MCVPLLTISEDLDLLEVNKYFTFLRKSQWSNVSAHNGDIGRRWIFPWLAHQ